MRTRRMVTRFRNIAILWFFGSSITESIMAKKNSSEEENKVFSSLDDYLQHYGAQKEKDPKQNEWYDLGTEAARLAIKHAEQ